MNEHRLTALEQFADTIRRESSENNRQATELRMDTIDAMHRLQDQSQIQQAQITMLRLMTESIIAHHPDLDAVKTGFQKRLAVATSLLGNNTDNEIPVDEVQKEMLQTFSNAWVKTLASC